MSFQLERQAIETKAATDWPTLQPGVDIFFDNVPEGPVNPGVKYARLFILPADSNQITLENGNGSLHRAAGVIMVQCFAPLGKGTKEALDMADSVATIFRNARLTNGVLCRSPRRDPGRATGSHYQVNVIVPFQRDTLYN